MTKLLSRAKMPRIEFWACVVMTALALFAWATSIWGDLDYPVTIMYTYFVLACWAFTYMDGQATYYHNLFHEVLNLAWKAHNQAERLREELARSEAER